MFPSKEFTGLRQLVKRFLDDAGQPKTQIEGACLAVCGPVSNEDCMVRVYLCYRREGDKYKKNKREKTKTKRRKMKEEG